MGSIIYGALLAILLVIAGGVLVAYYAQSFTVNFDFKDSLSKSALELQEGARYDGVKTLSQARGEVGTLTAQTSGPFSKVLKFPQLVGCLNIKNRSLAVDTIRVFNFEINYVQGSTTFRAGNTLEISPDKPQKFNLLGIYSPYNVPLDYFSGEFIEGVSIYDVSPSAPNPISEGRIYQYNSYSINCDEIEKNFKPLQTIPFA